MATPKWACNSVHDWHYSLWVICNRNRFGLIINKLITHHLVDGARRGTLEVDRASCLPCCMPPPPSQLSWEPLSISAAERTLPKSKLNVQATRECTTDTFIHTCQASGEQVKYTYNLQTLRFLFSWESTDIFTGLIEVSFSAVIKEKRYLEKFASVKC